MNLRKTFATAFLGTVFLTGCEHIEKSNKISEEYKKERDAAIKRPFSVDANKAFNEIGFDTIKSVSGKFNIRGGGAEGALFEKSYLLKATGDTLPKPKEYFGVYGEQGSEKGVRLITPLNK